MGHLFHLIVFDLDGTLVDSRRDIADAVNALLIERGAPALSEGTIGRMVGDGAAMLVARALEAAGLAMTPDALPRFIELYDERLLVHTRPYPDIPDVLAGLAERASLAVLTNKPIDATRRILAGLDLARYFAGDRVMGGDGPFPRKPDPTALRHLAEAAGVPLEETVLVGDSIIDWRTARNAEAAVCLARYGFGFAAFPIEQLRAGEWIVESPADLLATL